MNVTATASGDADWRFEELLERYSRTMPRHQAAHLALLVYANELSEYERAAICPECGSKCYDEERRRAHRSDARYCSNACRQRAYRRRKREG